jgi:STE24 endopeptidase
MPVPLLVALFVAFGLDTPRGFIPDREVPGLLLKGSAGIIGVGLLAIGLGAWIAWRISVYGYMTTRMRKLHLFGGRFLILLALGVYAWILLDLGWGGIVDSTWKLDGWFLVDHLAVVAPFVLMQLLLWCGMYLVDRALHARSNPTTSLRIGPYLLLRARNALGLILPVVLVFLIRHDVIGRLWPQWTAGEISEPVDFAILGGAILCFSPFFVRLAFPTHPLPEGPLRHRLEHLAERVGFRFRDILVWDTERGVVNACVTGVLPGFRYVLLTDALIESLEPKEISAVFGHEIGHVAHRHLPFFAFFFLGSLGLLTLAASGASDLERWIVGFPAFSGWIDTTWSGLVETGLALASVGLFFWLAFGHLSRRFERQADVFGCTVVSCGHSECPPHDDPDDELGPLVPIIRGVSTPCPTGIRIFATALSRVARQNGMEFRARSWRHGSIANRIAFLESLRDDPNGASRFQRGIHRLRIRWGIVLVASLVLAIGSHALSILP